MTEQPQYPFCAVIGQSGFKLALILAAINPAIGGVLVSGPRGCAKSTLVRSLADLRDHAPFVTLPLGASEEMLIGTLNLQQVLNDKQVEFQPGLLSKAHKGVLYVDEVNLLPDALIDQLLDVAASGVNHVERDGISHQHDSRFMLIGTMNPGEGELREQLTDRFGLMVELDNKYSISDRVAIVKMREAYERDPTDFSQHYLQQQQSLQQQVKSAQALLAHIQCSEAMYIEIAQRCDDAQVDGLRADIVWYRAAVAHAAWRSATSVELQDIEAVAELVLAHRRRQRSTPQPPSSTPPFQRPPSAQQEPEPSADKPPSQGWGGMGTPEKQNTMAVELSVTEYQSSNNLQRKSVLPGKRQGKQVGEGRKQGSAQGQPNWFATLTSALPNWPPEKIQYRPSASATPWLHLVLLDTSASTLQQQWFGQAKGALLKIAEMAYVKREQLAVWGFGNNDQQQLLAKVRAPKDLTAMLNQVRAGGGTPLRLAVEKARHYLTTQLKQHPQLNCCTYILTDGRSREQLDGCHLPGHCLLIDTEQSAVKRGRGVELAAQLGADYLPLATL